MSRSSLRYETLITLRELLLSCKHLLLALLLCGSVLPLLFFLPYRTNMAAVRLYPTETHPLPNTGQRSLYGENRGNLDQRCACRLLEMAP